MNGANASAARHDWQTKVGDPFADLLCDWRAAGAGRTPLIMGIVNVTPDSFSDGGLFFERDAAIAQGLRLAKDGAAILDVGGESSRKGATLISEDEEKHRVLPVIEALREADALLSIDTMKSAVAEAAIDAGVHIVNDIRGLQGDPDMARVAARHGAGVVAMHNPGLLGSAEPLPGDPVETIRDFFETTVTIAHEAGIGADRMMLDPGFGFGKSAEQNLAILDRLTEFDDFGFPLLVGTSRKSFIGAVTGRESGERLVATLATGVAAALAGAAILRVHDVAEHVEAMRMIGAIAEAGARSRQSGSE